jgi:molybdate transport system substrate-binding protein
MAELGILGTIALKGVLAEHEPDFRARTGIGFSCVWGPTGTVHRHCRAGETHDVLIAVPSAIDTMISEGHAVAGSRIDVTRSVIGIAVKAGAPHPKIDTIEDVQAALRAAKAVAYTDPATQAASGLHVARLLHEWGMTAEISAKARLGSGGPVAEFLVSGEADIAIQQLCEHMLVSGVEVVGRAPEAMQLVTTMSVGLCSRARSPDAARVLIDWLASPASHPVLRRHGLFPLHDL